MAKDVAVQLGWGYYETVISSRTQAQDLLWRFDALRRLNDAQVNKLHTSFVPYINPGVLWWAFDFESAKRRGAPENIFVEPAVCPGENPNNSDDSVVLLDEIDKADPDLPNNLLVPIDARRFHVSELDSLVKAKREPLILITTNEERELPKAFLRRCVVLTIEQPTGDSLIQIAKAHCGDADVELYAFIAEKMTKMIGGKSNSSTLPSTAEYLDAIKTCQELGIKPNSSIFDDISRMTLFKSMNIDKG